VANPTAVMGEGAWQCNETWLVRCPALMSTEGFAFYWIWSG